MPRQSDDLTLTRALAPAVLDRESYAQAYGGKGPEAEAATALKFAFEALRGKSLKSLTSEERETARLALIYAEQWEASLAEANEGLPDAQEPLREAAAFRKMRLRLWGRTAMEAALADGKHVDIRSL
ncbi:MULTISPECIES: hypothetical protein [unclassified Variovorax]|uniref:hypothetical protein n=1 Tax=unclassified Variovorax TaxID=663243 RepID=UPI00076D522D|nr:MULTISPECIES: hypothetical protein [unclassified Variovorax]KWT98247.1 hypothetical protein APY03_0918 [Variovorax sp. WDL1]PNG50252.1 hypothetical protein CHC06_05875 [Variovorax sp. B2]PNG51125.1 hypothetical protein CHC07_05781 [Variovorax sp. B4]VTV17324.1 hypothetical protein WDL1P1_00296 [Variovorax sp. WDL1]